MVRTGYGTIVLGAACALMAGVAHGQRPSRAPSVYVVLDSLLPAANAHDTDRFLASYVHDSSLVMIFNGRATVGYDSVRAQQLRAWANSDVVYRQRAPMHLTWLGHDLVVVTDPLRSERTLPTGEVKRTDFWATMVLERRADGWRIVHVRESTVQ